MILYYFALDMKNENRVSQSKLELVPSNVAIAKHVLTCNTSLIYPINKLFKDVNIHYY